MKKFAVSVIVALVVLFCAVEIVKRETSLYDRIQVAPVADKLEVNGKYVAFSRANINAMLEMVMVRGGQVPLIVQHRNTIHGGAAAGWLSRCEIEGNGLWCDLKWTTFGRKVACGGEYRFISPGWMNGEGSSGDSDVWNPTVLLEASLVNEPAIHGMKMVKSPPCPIPFFSRYFASQF